MHLHPMVLEKWRRALAAIPLLFYCLCVLSTTRYCTFWPCRLWDSFRAPCLRMGSSSRHPSEHEPECNSRAARAGERGSNCAFPGCQRTTGDGQPHSRATLDGGRLTPRQRDRRGVCLRAGAQLKAVCQRPSQHRMLRAATNQVLDTCLRPPTLWPCSRSLSSPAPIPA